MRKRLVFLCCVLLMTACLASAGAATLNGRGFEDFEASYAENLDFINQNTGRHLLPLVLARGDANEDGGHRMYELLGDVLSVVIRLDQNNEVIEICEITLAAPAGMTYGSSEYNDFVTSGYHSYALLMAMHTASDPLERYDLVTAVNEGLLAGDGQYVTQVGVYSLICTRTSEKAIIAFQNTLTAEPAGTDAPAQDEGTDGSVTEQDDGVYSEEEGYIG